MKSLIALMLLLVSTLCVANERIITIGGDITEIVFALGVGEKIVARDSTSLVPEQVKKLPDVGYVRQLNAEGILSLRPTLIFVSELAQPTFVVEQLRQQGIKVVIVPGTPSLETIPKKIDIIAKNLQLSEQGDHLIQQFKRQLTNISKTPLSVKVLAIMYHAGTAPMAAGQNTAADQMIRSAGGSNAMQGFTRYRPVSQEGVLASQPDLLLVPSMTVQELGGIDKIWAIPGLIHTPAGKHRRIVVIDDMSLLGFTLDTPNALAELRKAMELS